jgi:hypothetical protein
MKKVSRKLKNSYLRMLIFLDNNSQEPRMLKSLRLLPVVLAENLTQIFSLGGGIFLDFPNRLEIYGLENLVRKNVIRKSVKRKNVIKKKKMNLIFSEKTMKRI